MEPMPTRARIDVFALLLASLAASASSFVMWAVWTSTTESLRMPGPSMLF